MFSVIVCCPSSYSRSVKMHTGSYVQASIVGCDSLCTAGVQSHWEDNLVAQEEKCAAQPSRDFWIRSLFEKQIVYVILSPFFCNWKYNNFIKVFIFKLHFNHLSQLFVNDIAWRFNQLLLNDLSFVSSTSCLRHGKKGHWLMYFVTIFIKEINTNTNVVLLVFYTVVLLLLLLLLLVASLAVDSWSRKIWFWANRQGY